MLFNATSISMSDELMSEAKSSDFEFFIDFDGLNYIFLEGFHVGMHIIDRECATTDEDGVCKDELLNCGYLLK